MLDEDQTDTAIEADEGAAPPGEHRTKTSTVVFSVIALAIVLSLAYFPAFYKSVAAYDDEGSFLLVIRQFMHHGSLYVHTHSSYGPFYFSLTSLIFRLIGQDPVLTNGRLIVLTFTACSVSMFAAAVWRATRSLPFALLVEVAAYIVLVPVAGNEPMHPGTLVVLVLSVLAYALVAYAIDRRSGALVAIGISLGALAMIKINVGSLAAAGVVVAFVVGNSQYPKIIRVAVGAAAAILPFFLTSQLLYQTDTSTLAVIVSVAMLATYATLSVDAVSIPRRALWVVIMSAAGAVVLSCLWPLMTGSSPVALFHSVVIRPTGQANLLQRSHGVQFDTLSFVLTMLAVYAVLAHRNTSRTARPERTWQLEAVLGVAALMVLGLVVFGGFGSWLPAIALVPALAYLSAAPQHIRFILRLLVPLAILQFLHVYPVAGSQAAWARVAACVPCVIALAVAVEYLPTWREVGPALRALAIGSLCLVFITVAGFVPMSQWHNYNNHVALGLRGTRFVKVTQKQRETLHRLTSNVKRHCDTFYSAPGFDSLYIYTGLRNPTGMLADAPGALDAKEQGELITQLEALRAKGERICIVRDVKRQQQWNESSYGNGPLGQELALYNRRIYSVDRYTISIRNRGTA